MQGISRLILALLLLLPLRVVAGDSIWFLYEESNDHHQEYLKESEAMLRHALPTVEVRRLGLSDTLQLPDPREDRTLLITVGSAAAQRAAGARIPTLNTLITSNSFNAMSDEYQGPVSAIYLDQPVARHLELIKLALPARNKLTILLGTGSQQQVGELEREARRLRFGLRLITVGEDDAIDKLFGSELLADDTLLLLPDPTVVNRRTVKPLVLGSYRQGVPLIGYSQALVKAGALIAVYSGLPDLERDLLGVAKSFFSSGVLPAPHYIKGFDVSVNYQLARALKISLPAESILTKALKERLR